MSPPEIYHSLTPIFRDIFEDDAIIVSPELNASMVEGWTSLANIRLFLAIEENLKLRFDAAEIESVQNVQELVDLIVKKRSAAGAE